MADVWAWIQNHWRDLGWVSTVGVCLTWWVTVRKERRDANQDRRDGELHPLEKKKREQEIELQNIAIKKAAHELKELEGPTPGSDASFFKEVAEVTLHLAMNLRDHAWREGSVEMRRVYDEFKRIRGLSDEDVVALVQKDFSELGPMGIMNSSTIFILRSLHITQISHHYFITTVALWNLKVVIDRTANPTKNLEEIYQEFRTLNNDMSDIFPDSVHQVLATKELRITPELNEIWELPMASNEERPLNR